MDLQTDLSVEPTGAVDAETLAALEDLLITISSPMSTSTPSGTPTSSPSET